VIQGISIGARAMIGAGTTVLRDVASRHKLTRTAP
jgi:acetyltransferase-like isoleucine patch superfamily enzyme